MSEMSSLIATRVAAFALTSLLAFMVPPSVAGALFYAFLYSHFILQFVYSPRQVRALAYVPWYGWLLMAAAMALVSFTPFLPLAIFAIAHNIWSEIYVRRFASFGEAVKPLRLAANICIFSLCMTTVPQFNWVPVWFLELALAISCVGLVIWAMASPRDGNRWGLCAYEWVGAAFALSLPQRPFELRDMIFYHVAWWFFYPMPDLVKVRGLKTYLALTLGLAGAVFLLTPAAGLIESNFASWVRAGDFSGNFHIAISLVLSTANPALINRIFQPHLFLRSEA